MENNVKPSTLFSGRLFWRQLRFCGNCSTLFSGGLYTTVLYTKYVRNTKNYFPPEQKKLTQHHHNCMENVRTKNYFPPEPKKTDTTPQLYGTLST